MNAINEKRILDPITLLEWIFILISAMSAGAWLAGFLVQPDPVTESDVRDFYRRAASLWDPKHGAWARSQDKSPYWQKLFDDPEWVAARIEEQVKENIEYQRWESRHRVQKIPAIMFWPAMILSILLGVVRRENQRANKSGTRGS